MLCLSVPFSSNGFFILQILRKAQQDRSRCRFFLLRRCRLRAILAGFGTGASFIARII